MEASQPKYFVNGFMIKHFGIYPVGFNKENLFEEQKVFLIYLMGSIPSLEEWTVQVDYKTKKEEINAIKNVEITKTEIDLAKLQKRSLSEVKKEKIISEKKRKLKELDEKFGIKETENIEEIKIAGLPEMNDKVKQEQLWELLQGKNIIKTDK